MSKSININSINIQQVIAVAKKLENLKDDVVFTGGSTTALLVDDIAVGTARQTEDVDFIVDITVSSELSAFEKRMRSLGFKNDTSPNAPICRWLMDFQGGVLKVDAMPPVDNVLGFTNRWYQDAIKTANLINIMPQLTINIIDPVYFLGTKFEAYRGRGGNDIFSHDFEDIIYVLEHRSSIEREVYDSEQTIKSYLVKEFSEIMKHPDLENSLPGLLDNQDAVDMVLGKMNFIKSV